ncbi:MAG: DUF131 domain-containing protein, partial [Thermoplasmata archaeon]|nr:DUF131 domain-containing protein [Thermoplasmata archaeon]
YRIPLALLVLGFLLLAYSVIEGTGEIHWVLFIPVFTATGIFAFLGTVSMIIAFLLFFLIYAREFADSTGTGRESPSRATAGRPPSSQAPAVDKKFGGVVLIGPIPLIFGSDPKLTIVIVALAIVLMIVVFLFIAYYLRI